MQKIKTQKDENLVLPKEQVENADLYKPVLNKITTTRKMHTIHFRSSFKY